MLPPHGDSARTGSEAYWLDGGRDCSSDEKNAWYVVKERLVYIIVGKAWRYVAR